MTEFPATRLSLLQRIRTGDESAKLDALGEFVENYRQPLHDFLVRAKGIHPSDADDVVSEFILHKVMQGRVAELGQNGGRFRNAVRVSLQRYLIDILRKQNREPVASTPFEDLGETPSQQTELDPIDRVWAVAVFSNALQRMKRESIHWQLFVDRVLTQPPMSYQKIIERQGYDSPQKASNALMTAKRTFNRIATEILEEQSSFCRESVLDDANDDPNQEERCHREDDAKLLKSLTEDPEAVRQAISSVLNPPAPAIPPAQGKSPSEANTGSNGGTGSGNSGSDGGTGSGNSGGDGVVSIGWDDVIDVVDASTESLWHQDELGAVFEDLLNRPLHEFGDFQNSSDSQDLKLVDCFATSGTTGNATLVALKETFNQRAKTRRSEFPKRIDIAMTFALICSYVTRGQAIDSITSMSEEQVFDRVERLTDKPWIPESVRKIFEQFLATKSKPADS